MKGLNLQQVIYCNEVSFRDNQITFPVVECSEYDDKSRPSLADYYKTGWIIESRNRGPVGFRGGAEEREVSINPPKKNPWEESPTQD